MPALKERRFTRRELVVEDYHGTPVADPYRWLEEDLHPEVQEWMNLQNADFAAYISNFQFRDNLKERLDQLWRYASSSPPEYVNGVYYATRNDGSTNQPILYRFANLDAEGETILDPNLLSEDGTVALMVRRFSPQGNYLAYSLSTSGSDWQQFRIMDLRTKENLPDVLNYVRFSNITWLPDESGFIYNRYPAPEGDIHRIAAAKASIYLHRLGQDQSLDTLIYADDEPADRIYNFSASDDQQWVFLSYSRGTLRRNKLYFKPFDQLDSPWLPIAEDFSEYHRVIGVIDNVLYVFNNTEAPFGRILSIELSSSGAGKRSVVLPDQGEMLSNIQIVNNQLLCVFLHHASHRIALYDLSGIFIRDIPLPGMGSIRETSSKQQGSEFFYKFSSVLYPDTIMRYDFKTQETSTWFRPDIDFPFDDYELVQEFYPSKDGTMVPIFISRKKGLQKDGSHPVLLYGYGGFYNAMTPGFSAAALAWLEQGGVRAVACIRGGSEYGAAWHRAGMLEQKQNCFDDFQGAAEYLIREQYTIAKRIGIQGGSNGGLLTGACLVQRPELFGAVVVSVPVIDMLRYHRFTVGSFWTGEYGNAENPEQFPFMYAYSPLHNVKMNTVYPPTLIMTADTDDRVVPGQARKFAATLHAADAGDNPIYIRIEKSAGHGHGKPIYKQVEAQTDLFTFLLANLKGLK